MAVTDQKATQGAPIESREAMEAQEKTGSWNYWSEELKGSMKMLERWHRLADRIHQRYLDQRTSEASSSNIGRESPTGKFKLNLFFSNTKTLEALLYGQVPKVDVSRRYDQANDDVARVAATILERLLNNDLEDTEDEIDSVLRATLQDRLVPGLGVAKVRYDCDTEVCYKGRVLDTDGKVIDPGTETTEVTQEYAPVDYFHWRDVLWSWSRTAAGLRWEAFRSYLSKDQVKKRYGADMVNNFEYKQQKMLTSTPSNDSVDVPEHNENWLRTEIWEIWDKETRQVHEINLDYHSILKTKPDPLGLREFFPSPRFMMANPTTSLYIPTPDWHLVQDLYNEVDKLQTRIAIITEAVKVVGVYDASSPEVQRMMKEGVENDLIPVDRWAMLAEKGGLKGVIDWFPIEDVVNALINLRQLRDESIELLQQITGMADVMRGELRNQYEAKGQTDTKVEFASIRVQDLQNEFATFTSNLMQLKAQVIINHFEPESIARQANAAAMPEDPGLIEEAIQLLKSPAGAKLRTKVKSENLAMTDYARLRRERGEFLEGLSMFLTAAAPLLEQDPRVAPFLLQLLQWGLAGFRGADEIEGVVDQAIETMQRQPDQEQPDSETQRLQAQQQLEQAKIQGQLQVQQAKLQAELQRRQADMQADIQTKQAEHQMTLAETAADLRAEVAKIQAKAEADMLVEQVTSSVNAEQQAAGVEAEVHKDIIDHRLDLEAKAEETALKIREAKAVAQAKPVTGGSDSE